MHMVIALLWNGFLGIVQTLVGRVVAALGMAAVTYTGVSATLGFLKSQAMASFAGLPPVVYGMLSTMKVGVCISMVFSAIVIRATLNGLTSDTIKKFEVKK